MKQFPHSALIVAATGASLLLCSCGHVREKSRAYIPSSTDAAQVGGARVITRLDPQGGNTGLSLSAMVYFAASFKTEGPYQVVVAAQGREDLHQWLEIKSIRFRTASGKSNHVPASAFKEAIFFEPTSVAGTVQAVYRSPIEFTPDWEQDGAVTVEVDLSIADSNRQFPGRIRQTFTPQNLTKTEFVNVIAEIGRALTGNRKQGEDLVE